jgi:hypothetical protein
VVGHKKERKDVDWINLMRSIPAISACEEVKDVDEKAKNRTAKTQIKEQPEYRQRSFRFPRYYFDWLDETAARLDNSPGQVGRVRAPDILRNLIDRAMGEGYGEEKSS